jgi:hypothetical protein
MACIIWRADEASRRSCGTGKQQHIALEAEHRILTSIDIRAQPPPPRLFITLKMMPPGGVHSTGDTSTLTHPKPVWAIYVPGQAGMVSRLKDRGGLKKGPGRRQF